MAVKKRDETDIEFNIRSMDERLKVVEETVIKIDKTLYNGMSEDFKIIKEHIFEGKAEREKHYEGIKKKHRMDNIKLAILCGTFLISAFILVRFGILTPDNLPAVIEAAPLWVQQRWELASLQVVL